MPVVFLGLINLLCMVDIIPPTFAPENRVPPCRNEPNFIVLHLDNRNPSFNRLDLGPLAIVILPAGHYPPSRSPTPPSYNASHPNSLDSVVSESEVDSNVKDDTPGSLEDGPPDSPPGECTNYDTTASLRTRLIRFDNVFTTEANNSKYPASPVSSADDTHSPVASDDRSSSASSPNHEGAERGSVDDFRNPTSPTSPDVRASRHPRINQVRSKFRYHPFPMPSGGSSTEVRRRFRPDLFSSNVPRTGQPPRPVTMPSSTLIFPGWNEQQTLPPMGSVMWNGRRKDALKSHLHRNHPDIDPRLMRKKYLIYDPKPFLDRILNDRVPVMAVASDARLAFQEGLRSRGRQ